MKSYSVKSNAKRFARAIAAKHPEHIEAIEPVEIEEGAKEWWPAIRVTGAAPDSLKIVVFDSYGADVVIHGLDNGGVDPAILAEGDAGVYGVPAEDMSELADASGLKAAFDAVPPVGDIDATSVKFVEATASTIRPYQQALIDSVIAVASGTGVSIAEMAAAAADLPPPVLSTREEIDARRAERRQRIEAEKAAGTRDAAGSKVAVKKISKKKILIDLMKRETGATQSELETGTGWQRHTLRGYIAGTLRKQLSAVGFDVNCVRGQGEVPTRYFIEPVAPAVGGEA
jgi:hypothetical protein